MSPSPRQEVRRRYPGTREEGPLHSSVRLGRVHGIEIGLNWTWLIVFALIVWSLAATVFPTSNPHLGAGVYIAMAAAAAILFFTSLVLHELGHAVVAQREGMQIAGITLWVFGGVARFKGMFPSAWAEFRIAIAGPLVSLAIGLACVFGAHALSLPRAVDGVLTWLGYINVLLVVFNMMPALPLDGGRVLRSLLWARSGNFGQATARAGAIATGIGRVMIFGGIALLIFAASPGGIWLALIGWFVVVAARAETSYGVAHDALTGLRVSDATIWHPVTAPAGLSAQRFLDELFEVTHYASYPVVSHGSIVGLIAVGDVAELSPAELERLQVSDAMVGLDDTLVLRDDLDLAEGTAELLSTALGRALVTHEGEVQGLISLSDVDQILEDRIAAVSYPSAARRPPTRPQSFEPR